MTNIKEKLREEFGEWSVKSDFFQEAPGAIADFWLSKRDTELKTLLEKVEEMGIDVSKEELSLMVHKFNMLSELRPTKEDIAEAGVVIQKGAYNRAVTDISKIIKTLIGE